MNAFPEPAVRVNGGALGVGNGLLMLIRETLEPLPPGAVLAVRTSDPSAAHDLPAWCRIMGHTYLGIEPGPEGHNHFLGKSPFPSQAAGQKPDWGIRLPLRQGQELHTQDWMVGRAGQVPEVAPTTTGFAPRGAVVEE